ncbi:PAAR motif family protein [Acinetobacter sp. 1000160]|nr:PAAR motif family protein [Acinetobacter baumannii 146457]EYT20021.1 PAAR motif family protein [Acinetobacter sp. 1000160]
MAKGFAIHNAFTDHGGMIPATQMMSSQQGNLFVRAGDGHFCPKCRCWSTVIKSHDHVIFDGKPVAYVGDKLTCGATIMPQQTHVVGSSGSGSTITTATSSFVNNKQNTTDSFVDTKYAVELLDVDNKPFIPLGVPSFDGKPSTKELVFTAKVKHGAFEAIALAVKQDGAFVEVKKIEKAFISGSTIKIAWDGFINDLYNSKLFTKESGLTVQIKGYNGGSVISTDEKTFKFKYFKKDWMDVVIGRKTKKVYITLRVNLTDGGASGLFNGHFVPDTQIKRYKVAPYRTQTKAFSELLQLALTGINYYWGRNNTHPTGKYISIHGENYEVFVKAISSVSNAMPEMKLNFVTNVNPNDPMFRSSNSIISRKTAYMTGYLNFDGTWGFYGEDLSSKKFKETVAHETGHAIISAYAGSKESITHHGSSEIYQSPKKGTTYPMTGEMDLMKYAEGSLTSIPGWDARLIANEKDVISLIFISGISLK